MIKYELKKFSAQTGLIKTGAKKPESFWEFASSKDTDPELIKVFESKTDGLSALAFYQNICEKVEGFAGSFYQVTAYGLEENEYDDDDEWIGGGNMWCADDKEE